jgi:hypothetical protein
MGCDALKLDLYGLLSFAAVQKTSQHQVGTSVRLHLKDEHVEKIRTGLQELDAYCRRIEIDVTVRIDGAETTIRPKPTEFSNSEILKPFFQDRGQELEIQYRRLNAGHDGGVSGAFGLVCHRRGEVLYPGYRSWFALTERLGRNVSQLGFAIPFEQLKLNSLLARLAVTSVFYELDLSGAMRLELDPSRTRVQLSDHNHGIAADLDAKFSEFILDIFEYHWKSLTRQLRFDVFDQLARIVLHHVLDRGQTKIGAKAVSPLIDLFFENTPFEVASIAEKSRMSWNEIRALRKPIVPLYRYQRDSASGFDDIVDEVLQIRPDVVVVVFDGSHRWADKFFWLADTTGVILAEKCKHSLAVYQPWQGNFIELVTRRWEPPHNPWSFIQPFSPSGNCAFVTPNVPPRTAEMSSWVNGSHHKIATMIRLASKFKNEQASRTFNFFQFLQNEGRVGSPQSDFAEYVIEQQRMALNEFREAGAISKADVEL